MYKRIIYIIIGALIYSFSLYAASGKCGNDITWYLNEQTGVLTISGSGAMVDWKRESQESPWYQNLSIKKVIINSGVTSIGDRAFLGCEKLTSITIPSSVTSIGSYAFSTCKSLPSITIPNSVTRIGEGAFWSCYCFTSITIPNSVTSIENNAFTWCKNLISVTIPNSVTSIGKHAFYYCKSLTSITIPNSVTSISEHTFEGCVSLASVIIPNSVTSIGWGAFEDCTGLTSITIPNSVTSIENYAFARCNSLTSVIIGNGATNLGERAFTSCNELNKIYYPRGLDISNVEINPSTKLVAYDPSNPPKINPAQPPVLSFIEGSLSFDNPSNNKCIDANEQCAIKFKIKNNGKGAAQHCEARVKLSGTTSGISVQNVKLPLITAGQTYEISVPVTSNLSTQDGNVTISIEVYEPNGWGVAPFDVEVSTKAFVSPLVQIVDYNITSPSGKVHRMEPFTISFTAQNIEYGDAENVNLKIITPQNVIIMEGSANLSFPLIKSGEKKSAQIVLAVNNNYEESSIPVVFDIKEKYGKYAESKNFNIELAQTTPSTQKLTVQEEKTTYKIVSYKEMALTIAGTPRISILTNTSVSVLRPEWYNKYLNQQNIKSPFPYAAIKLELKGDKEAIDVAKERLSLVMGGKHIVEVKDTKETNTIWFLVHCRNEYIDLDCGDGCEPINIWKERLEPNKVYTCPIEVTLPDK